MKIKICKIHGELTTEQVYTYFHKGNNKIITACKLCSRASNKKLYRSEKHQAKKNTPEEREKHRLRNITYRATTHFIEKKNSQKFKEYYKERYKKNRSALMEKSKIESENLTDAYIRTLLNKDPKVKLGNMGPGLIELKRILIKLKRALKEKRDHEN